MRTFIRTPLSARAAFLSLALLTVGACGKKANQTDTTTAGGAIAPASGAVQVSEVAIGRGVTPDKHVANPTDNFSSRDTLVASVHTTGSAPTTNLTARLTFQDGQVADERSETIAPNGDAYTEFHFSKPSGWPAGKYTVHVLVNGQEVQTKNLTVK